MENILFKDWLSALGWAIIGIAFVKVLIYPYGVNFSPWRWIKENIKDVLAGLLLTLIVLKLGLVLLIVVAKWAHIDLEGIDEALSSVNLDSSQLALIVAIIFQYKQYKSFKASVKKSNIGGDMPDPDKEEK
jgi:hypothetical protein